MSDSTELYYAEMEAARNRAEYEYFDARPHLDTQQLRDMFCAGFERGFKKLWNERPALETFPARQALCAVHGQRWESECQACDGARADMNRLPDEE
jgi:hypothetical protein